ncbi:MAG TPA: polysaccharide deacetylase family protein, partial [Patescibacteria group bacterium]|nr:polysaccharide deacetylase family protein [Patescibacteria group bacterium]
MYFYAHIAVIFVFVMMTGFAFGDESHPRVIVLTFDDGPREEVLTGHKGLLALLQKENVHGTFFVQGWRARKNPGLVREMVQEGHSIANHTYGHATPLEWAKIHARKKGKPWKALNKGEQDAYLQKGKEVFLNDVERGRLAIESITGHSPIFMRPPKWDIDQDLYCKLSGRYVVQMIPGMVRALHHD